MAHRSMVADGVDISTTHQIGRIHLRRILIRVSCLHLQAVCRRCPLGGFHLSLGLVTTPEGHLDLLVAECPINTPRTRPPVNIKATKDTIREATKGTRDTKEIKGNKDIMVATRIAVEVEEAMGVIVEAGPEAKTVITMAVTAVVVVVAVVAVVTIATRGDNGVMILVCLI